VNRIRAWLVAAVALLVAVPAIPAGGVAQAPAHAAAAACGTRVDIGVTVYDRPHGVVKGSGSYTTQSCLAISSVYLVIVRGQTPNQMGEVAATKVTRYPPEPSSAKFSPRDYRCRSHTAWYWYKTKISWRYSGGGGGTKYSNSIRVDCY
jgi:hypothetical protein